VNAVREGVSCIVWLGLWRRIALSFRSSSLIVKVFEINAQGYYRQHLREVDTDINLDGLVANEEKTHPYADSPLLRVTRKFEFPKLNKSGVYVIDFIGNGRSSPGENA